MRISDWSSDVCSSDLTAEQIHQQPGIAVEIANQGQIALGPLVFDGSAGYAQQIPQSVRQGKVVMQARDALHGRSEEHTSELQSLMRISYAVFCLKKKTNA